MNRTQAKTKIWLVNNKDEPVIGEGKAALLKSIKEEGSLNKAYNKKTGRESTGNIPDRKGNKLT